MRTTAALGHKRKIMMQNCRLLQHEIQLEQNSHEFHENSLPGSSASVSLHHLFQIVVSEFFSMLSEKHLRKYLSVDKSLDV